MTDTVYRCRRCGCPKEIPGRGRRYCSVSEPSFSEYCDWEEGVFVSREILAALLIDRSPLGEDQLAKLRKLVAVRQCREALEHD